MNVYSFPLFLLLIVCALSLITSQQTYRVLFNQIQKERRFTEMLDSEYDKFQIELEQDNKDTKQVQKSETIRITTEKLDEVLNTASEVFITRIRLQNDLYSLNSSLFELKKIIEIDSNIRKNEEP